MASTRYRCERCDNAADVAIPTMTVHGTQAPVLIELTRTVTCTGCYHPMITTQPHDDETTPEIPDPGLDTEYEWERKRKRRKGGTR